MGSFGLLKAVAYLPVARFAFAGKRPGGRQDDRQKYKGRQG